MAISTNGAIITRVTSALYGEYLSNASYDEVISTAPATLAATFLSNDFAGKTDMQIATTMLTNLGLTSITGLDNWLSAQLTAAGSTTAAKGAKIVSIMNDYANLTADATYGTYATAFNAKVAAGLVKSQTAGNAGGAYATADAVSISNTTTALSTGLDNVLGGAGNDTINGVATTFQTGDIIDGGAGTDTVYVSVATDFAPTRITNVEKFIVNPAGAGTANFNAVSGISSVELLSPVGVQTISKIAGTVAVAVTNSSTTTTVAPKGTTLTGAADNFALTVNGVTGAVTVASDDVNDYETASIASSTVASTLPSFDVGDSGAASTITGLTITGDAALTITAALGASIKTVNASAATAAVKLTVANATGTTVTGGAGNDNITAGAGNDVISGGAGNDTIVAGAAGNDSVDGGAGNDTVTATGADANDTIVGGDGTDTLTLTTPLTYTAATSSAALVNQAANVTGFEKLSLSGAQVMTGLNAGNAITSLAVPNGGTATVTDAPATLVNFTFAATGAASVTLGTTADGAADNAAVTLGSATGQAASVVSSLTVAGYDTATVSSVGADGNQITSLVGTKLTSVTLSGDKTITDLNLAATTVAVKTIDASAYTAATLTGVDGSSGATAAGFNFVPGTATSYGITGGAGSDTITGGALNDTLAGGDGNDTIDAKEGVNDIQGGAGNDVLTAGAGNDTIQDGSGNDVVTAGAGDDTVTLGSGSDSVNAGAGNDTITASTNLDSADTIGGGDGTDTLTATFSSVGATPTITGVETLRASFGASTFVSGTKIDASTTAITVDSASAAAVSPTIKDLGTGVTLTLTDDNTLGGTAGNLGAVTLDTVAAATLAVKVAGNADVATATATSITSLTVTDAVSVALSSSGGSTTNVINHATGAIALDAVDTTSLSITTAAGSGLTGASNITGTTAVTSVTLSAASYGDINYGTIVDGKVLNTLSLTAAGESSDVTLGAVGGGTTAALTTLSLSASAGGTVTTGAINSTANMDSLTISGTGTSSAISPSVGGTITTNAGSINSVTLSAADRATVTLAEADLIVGAGLVSTLAASATSRATLNLSGFLADSTATGVAASYGFTTSDRGVMTLDAGTSITTNGDLSALSLTVGSDSTFNAAAGATVSAAGTIASTSVSVASDATTTGELSLGEVGTVHTAATVTLAEASANGADFNLIGKTFNSLSITLDGAAAITVAAAADADSITANAGTGQAGMTIQFDGNAQAIAVYNSEATAPTITALTLNAGSSTGTNTLNVSAASKATVTGGSGADTITGTAGRDTISAGAGTDTITGGAGGDSFTGGTGVDAYQDVGIAGNSVVASASGLTAGAIAVGDSITFATTTAGNVDYISDFAATDTINFTTDATAPTNAVGLAATLDLVTNTGYVLYGTYTASTGVFVVAAGWVASTSQDALLVQGDAGTLTFATTTGYVVLDNLTAALVAGNIN
jgi:Ca2+-binding RTX toxin-like protein